MMLVGVVARPKVRVGWLLEVTTNQYVKIRVRYVLAHGYQHFRGLFNSVSGTKLRSNSQKLSGLLRI